MLGVAQRAVADAERLALEVVAGLDDPLVGADVEPERRGDRAGGLLRALQRGGDHGDEVATCAGRRPPGGPPPCPPSPGHAPRAGSRAAVRRARRRGCAPRRAASGGSWWRPWAQSRKHSCAPRTQDGVTRRDTRHPSGAGGRSPSRRRARRTAPGVSTSTRWSRTDCTWLGAAATRTCQPFSVMVQFTPRASSTQGTPRDEPLLLHAPDGVREPAAGVREVVGELRHPQRAVGRLGEPDQDLVLVRGQAGVALELGARGRRTAGRRHRGRSASGSAARRSAIALSVDVSLVTNGPPSSVEGLRACVRV